MKVKTYSYVVKVTDEDGRHVDITEVPDEVKDEMYEAISFGTHEGDIEYEDDSDEWEEMNRGDEIRDYRKNDC